MPDLPIPDQEEAATSRILFTLLERAHGKHWKEAFEIKIVLAQKEFDPPIPKEAVMPIARLLGRSIEFFHGAAVAIDLETLKARPAKGEAAAYVFFDGWTLTVGSIGYQAW